MIKFEEKRCQDIADELNMDVGDVRERMTKTERNRLLSLHPYRIYQGKDGNWYTYLPDRVKGRVFKKRKTKEDIENVVIEYWKKEENNPTVRDIFMDWLADKLRRERISRATKDRYESQFEQCFLPIAEKPIKSISDSDVEDFVLDAIHDNKLTAKGYSNLRTLLYGIFRLAKKKHLIDYSITSLAKDFDISEKDFRQVDKPDDKEVFMVDELPIVTNYLEQNQDIINLGILLLFKMGLRIGELSALKWSDIQDNIIYIHRTEVRYKDENGKYVYEVRDFPKTEAGIRYGYIQSDYSWLIKKIRTLNPFGEYVFMQNGNRIRNYSFQGRFYRVCKKTGVVKKSTNKARKTYGTILLDEGVPNSVIIKLMGHTDIVTTKKHYQRNRQNIEQIASILDKVSSL